jgi:hypothetical protein
MRECGKMRKPAGRIVLALGFCLFGAVSAPAQSIDERLAEARKTVETVRGRSFKRAVPTETVGAPKLRKLLAEKLVEGLVVDPEDYFRSLAAIGAISEKELPNLRDHLLDFYGGQVLAFYDPSNGKFFVSSSAKEKLGGFSGMEESLVFTHELTHALQDQYLSLDRRIRDLKTSGDAALGLEALLEGEATEVMIEGAVKDLPGAEESVAAMLAPLLTSSLADIEPDASKVPAFFSEQLFFPYSEGTAYVREKKARGGWKAIDALWDTAPASTSEILHPGQPAISAGPILADGAVPPPPGSSFLYSDTLGEWTLRFLFRKGAVADAETAAAAWRGDRFLFFKNGNRIAYAGRIRASDSASALRLLDAWKKSTPNSSGSVHGSETTVYSGFDKSPI